MEYKIKNEEPDADAPLAALRPSTQKLLSSMLNPIKVIPTDSDLPRDWRGLAELAGFTSEYIASLQVQNDPTDQILKKLIQSETQIMNFSDLKAFLGVIDRYDVVFDAAPLLGKDAELYASKFKNRVKNSASVILPLDSKDDFEVLTIDDSVRLHKGLPLSRYDAFILYSDDDSEFANEIITKMEGEYDLKMCVKDRDLLPGVMFEHEIIGRLIEERCNRLLVIFSPSFLESPANQFLVSYAQASALDTRVRKIIPCMYKYCQLPPSVRYSFCLDYNRSSKQWNFFWQKLSQSLKTAPSTHDRKISSPNPPAKYTELPSSKYASSLPDSLSWWDEGKTKSYDTIDSGISSNTHQDFDTMSISSSSFLVPKVSQSPLTVPKESKGKWFKKISSPIKKIRDKSKKTALAE